jgi:polysaccharide export outer membrane protein
MFRQFKLSFFLLSGLIILTGSCVSRKKLTYLQYAESFEAIPSSISDKSTSVTPAAYKVMPYDNLFIRVVTPDPQWSELFNPMSGGTGGTINQESAGLLGYPVDVNGEIEIPYVGKIEAAGKTLSELKSELEGTFKKYVNDAAITVRLVNNAISIIGEVQAPGRYPLMKDRVNVFEAISMAGDLTVFSKRQEIQLIRPSSYGPVVKEFSLTDRSILSSEFYYVMPNDIIYAKPSQSRIFVTNTAVYSLFLSTITTALVIIGFFRTI